MVLTKRKIATLRNGNRVIFVAVVILCVGRFFFPGKVLRTNTHPDRDSLATKYLTNKDICEQQYNSTPPPNALIRHGHAWVLIEDYHVLKHPSSRNEYFHEKEIATRLGKYPHFNKLLSFGDDCEVLVFERLFPRQKGFKYPAENTFNNTLLRQQLDSIFLTFGIEEIEPSLEIFMGLNNIFIGEEQNITMFDYHAYKKKFNSTHNHDVKDRLYRVILQAVNKNKHQNALATSTASSKTQNTEQEG